MNDYQATLERLREDAAKAALIRDLATDHTKRQTFARLAARLTGLADEVEQVQNNSASGPSVVAHRRRARPPVWRRPGDEREY